jgi:hypothetical protein
VLSNHQTVIYSCDRVGTRDTLLPSRSKSKEKGIIMRKAGKYSLPAERLRIFCYVHSLYFTQRHTEAAQRHTEAAHPARLCRSRKVLDADGNQCSQNQVDNRISYTDRSISDSSILIDLHLLVSDDRAKSIVIHTHWC